ncbi:ABC transporter permease [Streptomyces candidus]|uniref:Putative ABC transport system permease protein n=1 Tax=Streptomyces candidus TaxID=67283 RepID=A0A7X0HD34_9ACTN|nr:FtsX-like permease family protein [Streptomyces candidus]MBB6435411.1 putative ABC transport system permease protein [Streptomyces candidus]GHH47583.1 membrane protein [Streptomyces candidus]
MTVWKTSMRNFFAHKGRMALSAVAVLLSVGFVCGTLVFTDTMNTTFDKLFATSSADVTVTPEKEKNDNSETHAGRPVTLPASLLRTIAGAEGVQAAEGTVSSMSVTVVDRENKNMGSDTGAPTIASNWSSADARLMDITSGREPRGPTDLMVDADTAEKHGLKLGDELRTIAVTGDFTARISGIATFRATNPGATVVFYDEKTAQQKLLGGPDRYTGVNVTAREGVGEEELKAGVAAALGADSYRIQTKAEASEESKNDIASFLDVMKYAMLGFAGVALLVGIFLIINTFSMLVAQRTREIGLMRALGASRRQVNRSVLLEAVLLGVFGSLLGIGAGIGLAVGLMQFMNAIGMNLSTDDLTVTWVTPVVGFVLGVVVTVVAAYLPARRAGTVSPMAALRDAGTPGDGRAGRIRAGIGLTLTALGAAGLFAAARADEAAQGSLFLAAGVVLTLIGFVAVGPLLVSFVVKGLSAVVLRLFGPVGRMAERNALRNPRRTGATGSALMIGLALVACLSVAASSMVASANQELDKSVGADFTVRSNTGMPVLPQAQQALAKAEGIARLTHYKLVTATVTAPDGTSERTTLSATDPSYMQDLRRETVAGKLADAYAPGAMSVGDEYAEKRKVKVGDELTVAFPGGKSTKLKVAAITSDDVNVDKGAMYLDIATAAAHTPAERMPQDMALFAKAAEGQAEQAYASLKAAVAKYPQYRVLNSTDYKKDLKAQIDQLLNIIYGLLGLAIIVAVLGVVNTLALSVVERTREIGLMRAIGLSRRQLRRMIRLESVVIALFGALLGLALGLAWGMSAQKLLALEGIGVLEIPWTTIVTVFLASALVGLLAALVPAFRAGRMNVLNAIATE